MKTFFRVIGGLQQLTVGRRNGRSSAVDARDNILLANLYQHANFHFLQYKQVFFYIPISKCMFIGRLEPKSTKQFDYSY